MGPACLEPPTDAATEAPSHLAWHFRAMIICVDMGIVRGMPRFAGGPSCSTLQSVTTTMIMLCKVVFILEWQDWNGKAAATARTASKSADTLHVHSAQARLGLTPPTQLVRARYGASAHT
jgi:hypothetical protein